MTTLADTRAAAEQRVSRYLELAGQHRGIFNEYLEPSAPGPPPAGAPPVNAANVREGSEAPYQAILDDLGLGGQPQAQPGQPQAQTAQRTPIEEALSQGNLPGTQLPPRIQPGSAPQAQSGPQGQPQPIAGDPYATPQPAGQPTDPVQQQLQELAGQNAQLAQIVQGLLQRGGQPPEQNFEDPYGLGLDPAAMPEGMEYLDPEAIAYIQEQINSGIETGLQQQLQPYMPVLGAMAERESATIAAQQYEHLQTQIGRFDSNEAFMKAQALFAANPGADPTQVLYHSARMQHEAEARLWNTFRTLQGGQAAHVAGAPSEPAAAPAAASEIRPVPRGPDRYEIARDNFFASRGLQLTL